MLQQAFKKGNMSQKRVFEWFGGFKHVEISGEDHSYSVHPSRSQNDENISQMLFHN